MGEWMYKSTFSGPRHKLEVCLCRMAGWIIHYNLDMERSIHDLVWSTISASAWRNCGKPWKYQSRQPISGFRFESGTSRCRTRRSTLHNNKCICCCYIHLYLVNLLATTIKVWKIIWTGHVACRMKPNRYNICLKSFSGRNLWKDLGWGGSIILKRNLGNGIPNCGLVLNQPSTGFKVVLLWTRFGCHENR
jgi:hypothetical protein